MKMSNNKKLICVDNNTNNKLLIGGKECSPLLIIKYVITLKIALQ